jgi:hypothetical protein
VHLGLNGDLELIGRFPRSLFTEGFAEKAAAVRFGGMVTAPAADPSPMGSGYLPAAGDAAASVSNIQLVGRACLADDEGPAQAGDQAGRLACGISHMGMFHWLLSYYSQAPELVVL